MRTTAGIGAHVIDGKAVCRVHCNSLGLLTHQAHGQKYAKVRDPRKVKSVIVLFRRHTFVFIGREMQVEHDEDDFPCLDDVLIKLDVEVHSALQLDAFPLLVLTMLKHDLNSDKKRPTGAEHKHCPLPAARNPMD